MPAGFAAGGGRGGHRRLLISFLQAITSLQDSSISHGLKLIIVSLVIVVAAPWGAAAILQFANSIMQTLFT